MEKEIKHPKLAEDLTEDTVVSESTTLGPSEDSRVNEEKLPHSDYRNYSGEDIKPYGLEHSDDEDVKVESPEEKDDKPDLYRYLKALTDGDSVLENHREPPSLFNRPEHYDKYKDISSLKYEVHGASVPAYLDEFDSKTKDDVLIIGRVSLEEILCKRKLRKRKWWQRLVSKSSATKPQEEERRLRDAYDAKIKQELEEQQKLKAELAEKADITRKRIAKDVKEKRKLLAKMVEIARQKEKLQLDLLHKSFERSELQLKGVLQTRKNEVKRMYGDLEVADGDYGGTKGRRWKLDWDKAPQPIQVKLKTLRGVRDKLPVGQYVLMVSLYNRLGGHLIKWSNLKGQEWGGTTLPVVHEGRFSNSEIKLNQNLFTVLPSKPSIRPGMIIVFELYLLKGTVLNTDRVVAWGCFPICDGTFEVIEGKYKTPMIRGEIDYRMDKHSQIEQIMASSLDHWLCNAYFEIVRLPRYISGQKEYEVELQFSSVLVNHPDRINLDGEEYKDSENPVLGSAATSRANIDGSMSDMTSVAQTFTNKTLSVSSLRSKPVESDDSSSVYLDKKQNNENDMLQTQSQLRNRAGSARSTKNAKMILDESTDSDESIDEDEIFALKKGKEEFQPVPGEIGMYYKRHLNNPVDIYTKKLYSILPKGTDRTKTKRKKLLTYAEELEQYTPSVKPPFSEKGRIAERGWKRLSYTVRMFLAELGLSEWRSREFWAMFVLFILTFFIRMFLHYSGQYLFLKALKIPINSFNFLPYTVRLNYQSSLLHVMEETLIVIIGPLTVFLLFTLSVILCWISQKAAGMFPDLGSKFILMLGIQSFLDPILITVVDLIQRNYNYEAIPTAMPLADFSKLYWFLTRTQGSGVGGIFITGFIYLFMMFASGSVLYMYFLRLHNNGRMLDIYWRLHSQLEQMFVPYDLEVSLHELEYILEKAEKWRGEEGERRKVAVYEYVWEEEDTSFEVFTDKMATSKENKKKEKTVHIAIHTMHTDGLRELYRHFLALPDGAIVEVFGEMSFIPGLSKDIKKAINQGAKKVEHLLDIGSSRILSQNNQKHGISSLPSGLQTPVTGKGIHLSEASMKTTSTYHRTSVQKKILL